MSCLMGRFDIAREEIETSELIFECKVTPRVDIPRVRACRGFESELI
jgi:hypothetical protein